MKQRVAVLINYQLLADVLRIKKNNRIIAVSSSDEDKLNETLRIIVEGKDCYVVPKGDQIPVDNGLLGVKEWSDA